MPDERLFLRGGRLLAPPPLETEPRRQQQSHADLLESSFLSPFSSLARENFTKPKTKKTLSVTCATAALAAALAAVPCGAAARAFQRSFLALWPARVCLALYAAQLMASQPLALD